MVLHCSGFDHTFLTGPSELFSATSVFVVQLLCFVSQGSVLEVRLFIMYTTDLADLVADCQVTFDVC